MRFRSAVTASVTASMGIALILVLAPAFAVSAEQGVDKSFAAEDEAGAPSADAIPERAQSAGEAPASGAEMLFFVPQDNTDNTTVISLYSLRNDDQSVRLETFRLDGSTLVDEMVVVPARGMVRIVSDALVNPPPGDWGQAVYIQFFNTSAFARLTLPKGIKADAHIAWTNTMDFDPRTVVASLGLRFSKDPASAF